MLLYGEQRPTRIMELSATHPEYRNRPTRRFHHEQGALERAREAEVEGYLVRFTSSEAMVIHKILPGRPRDLEDIRSIIDCIRN